MKIRYYIDPETELPHIYRHNVSEQDVEEVLRRSGEDRLGREGSRVAIGCTSDGRYVRVIYVPDPEPDRVLSLQTTVFTASRWLPIGCVAGERGNEAK